MNFGLLRLLQGDDEQQLMQELGVERFVALKQLAQRYVLKDGVLYRLLKDRVCGVPVLYERKLLLKEAHESSGHIGSVKLYEYVKQFYYWPDLLQSCVEFVSQCVDCLK